MSNYEQAKNSSSEISPNGFKDRLTSKFKEWANRFDTLYSDPGTQPEKFFAISAAKIELMRNPNLYGVDRSQHRLEVADAWDDDMRREVVELNRLDPNTPRLSFEGALSFLEEYGNDFADGAEEAREQGKDYEDFEAQAAKVAMHRGMAERGDLDSLQWLIADMEEQLKLMGAWEDREGGASDTHREDVENMRRVRDALFMRYEQEIEKQAGSVVEGSETMLKRASGIDAHNAVEAAFEPATMEDPRQKLGETIVKTINTLQSDKVRQILRDKLGSIDELSLERSAEINQGLRELYKKYVFEEKPSRTQGMSGPEAAAEARRVQDEYIAAIENLLG